MCLITALPKGKVKYSEHLEKFIRNGMQTNTDGSGFMYKRSGTNLVNISKGYRTSDAILEAIKNLNLKEEDELVVHHRIGTSGEKNAINMHPFVVSESAMILQATEGEFNLPIMAHNGVFSEFTDRASLYNDTYHFVQQLVAVPEILALIAREPSKFEKLFKSILSYNKLAFLFPDRDMVLIGNFTEDDGYYHSNGGYKSYVYDKGGSSTKNYPSCWRGAYDGYDDDYYDMGAHREVETKEVKAIAGPSAVNTYPNNHRFPGELIKLTKSNHKHFIMIPRENIIHPLMVKNRGYLIEEFSDSLAFLWLVEMTDDKIMTMMYWDNHKDKIDLVVKGEYLVQYKGLSNLVKQIGSTPTKSMGKKLAKKLDEKYGKSSFLYKDYGIMKYCDLEHLYKVLFTDTEDRLQDTDEQLAISNFTLNEDFTS